MGKKRIAIIDESQPKKEGKGRQVVKSGLPVETGRRTVKSGKEHGRITDMGAKALEEARVIEEKEKQLAKLAKKAAKQQATQEIKKKAKTAKKERGKKYLAARKKVDRQKLYPLKEAVKLLKETAITKFSGSVEAHLNLKEAGLKGEVAFPYPTGKTQRIKVADEKLLKELEKGKIDFDVLLATPALMPQLVKFAKLLGPKGLMPNPKAGTITDEPEKLVKKMIGKSQFKSEAKNPLLHLVIGKVDQPENELRANFEVLVNTIGPKNILKTIIKSTMGPGIKVELD